MKKIYVLIFITALMFTVGCKLDEPVVPASLQNAQLLGKWNLSAVEVTTQTGIDVPSDPVSVTSFTDQDYFEFKEGNAATFSSSFYGKVYTGYYAINSAAIPQTLTFKSGDFTVKYFVDRISANSIVLVEITTGLQDGETTTTINRYTYNKAV